MQKKFSVFITGASSGLGKALAISYAKPENRLFLCGRNKERLYDVAAVCKELGPLRNYLCGNYKIVKHFSFPDHHKFTRSDLHSIRDAADMYPTSVIMTTEKDCQRIRDCRFIPGGLKTRMFHAPIKVGFLSDEDRNIFRSVLTSSLK